MCTIFALPASHHRRHTKRAAAEIEALANDLQGAETAYFGSGSFEGFGYGGGFRPYGGYGGYGGRILNFIEIE
jgi:hypothetical protein